MARPHLLSLSCMLLLAGSAQAADTSDVSHSLVLSRIDSDRGGKISKEEAVAAASAKIAALDLDHDGKLDGAELTGIIGSASVAKADADHDGTLDRAEYNAFVMRHFDRADTDHSGKLDAAELDTEPGRDLVFLLQY